jgi:hypothetical protein
MDWYGGPPGITTPRTSTPRVLFLQRSETFLAQGRLIAGDASRDPSNTPDVAVLRCGLIMGKITTVVNSLGTVGYYAPSIIGVQVGASLAGATSITVSAAVATEMVRRFGTTGTFTMTGPPAAAGVVAHETVTYSAINTTTGVITCTATVNAYINGAFIGPTDGSQTPNSFIGDYDYASGIRVVDQDAISIAAVDFPKLPIAGVIDQNQLLPVWPTDTSLQAWLYSRLNNSFGGQYVWGGKSSNY